MIIGGKAMPPEKCFESGDLYFDEHGQLIITNPRLKYCILKWLGKCDPASVPDANCETVLIPQGCGEGGGAGAAGMANPNCEPPITAGCGVSGRLYKTIECLIRRPKGTPETPRED